MAPAMNSYEIESKYDDIPVLDFSRIGEEEYCLETVREACQQLGCFRVVNHGISADLLLKAEQACRECFKLPMESKKRNVSDIPYAGYKGGIARAPFYESLGMTFSGIPDPQGIKDFSDALWPHGNDSFRQTMEDYTCEMMELYNKVLQLIAESVGMSNYYSTHLGQGKVLLRMNMYDLPSKLPNETVGLGTHTDLGSLSLLLEDDCGGLQVCDKAGHWIDVKPIPNTFIAMLGDCFQAWSNGRVRNVKHRVMVKGEQSRLSVGFFNGFSEDMDLKAFPNFIDDEHPQYYKPFTFGDLVKYWLGEGKGVEERLKTFAHTPMQ